MRVCTHISANSHYTHMKTYNLTTNAGEDAAKREPLYIGGENLNKISH